MISCITDDISFKTDTYSLILRKSTLFSFIDNMIEKINVGQRFKKFPFDCLPKILTGVESEELEKHGKH